MDSTNSSSSIVSKNGGLSGNNDNSKDDMMAMMQKMMANNVQTAATGFDHAGIAQSVTNLSDEYRKAVDEKAEMVKQVEEIKNKLSKLRWVSVMMKKRFTV